MKAAIFAAMLPIATREKLSAKALERWFIIYRHVFETGQADRFDSPLSKKLGYLSDAATAKILKQMADVGLLKPNRVVVKYTEIGRAFLGIGFMRQEGPPPGVFLRYTMPGMTPNLPILDRSAKTPRAGQR